MKPAPQLIVFDLDGTLVDSAPDLAFSVNAVLRKANRPPVGIDTVRSWIGNGVPMLVRRALTGEMWPQTYPAGFQGALSHFDIIYAANLYRRSRLYDGVREGLTELRAEGYRTACLTNKHSRFTLPLLKGLGVFEYFDYVGCGDQFAKHKPDPLPLVKTAEYFHVPLDRCLMVGDSENDVQAARAAGYAVICVPYGYRACERAEDLGADAVIASIADLSAYLRKCNDI
jgi:phosphoglycolate phosphatase